MTLTEFSFHMPLFSCSQTQWQREQPGCVYDAETQNKTQRGPEGNLLTIHMHPWDVWIGWLKKPYKWIFSPPYNSVSQFIVVLSNIFLKKSIQDKAAQEFHCCLDFQLRQGHQMHARQQQQKERLIDHEDASNLSELYMIQKRLKHQALKMSKCLPGLTKEIN